TGPRGSAGSFALAQACSMVGLAAGAGAPAGSSARLRHPVARTMKAAPVARRRQLEAAIVSVRPSSSRDGHGMFWYRPTAVPLPSTQFSWLPGVVSHTPLHALAAA